MATSKESGALSEKEEEVEVRWKIPKRIHKRIAVYQKWNELITMEQAAVMLLDQVTRDKDLIKL